MSTIIGLIVALALAGSLVYVLLRPRYAFLLVLLFFPLEQVVQAWVPWLMRVPWLLNVAVALTSATAAGMLLIRGQRPFRGLNNLQTWATCGLYFLVLFGMLHTPSRDAAKYFVIDNGLPYWALMLGVLPLLILSLDDFYKMLVPFMVIGSIISVLILANPNASVYGGRLTLEFVAASGEVFRGNPLVVSELGMMVAVVAALLVTRQGTAGALLLRAACFLAGMAVMLASGSRGQAIAMVVAVVALIPFAYTIRDMRQFLLLSVSGLFIVVLGYVSIVLFVSDETAARWTGESVGVGAKVRFESIVNMFGAFMSSPGSWLFGLGTNSYNAFFRPVDGSFTYPHNLFIEVLTEEGFLGLGFLCLSLWAVWKGWRWIWTAAKDDRAMRSAAAILGAFALVALLQALKQGTFTSIPLPFYIFLVVNKMARAEQMAMAEAESEPSRDEAEYVAALTYASRG
ncbi:MAG: hypothetical protein IPM33_06570 [Phycisphaerales bacterium]|nr:hypothetical protein [Phycisphaerales bacterium]